MTQHPFEPARFRDSTGPRDRLDAKIARQMGLLALEPRLPDLRHAGSSARGRRSWSMVVRLLGLIAALLSAGGAARAAVVYLARLSEDRVASEAQTNEKISSAPRRVLALRPARRALPEAAAVPETVAPSASRGPRRQPVAAPPRAPSPPDTEAPRSSPPSFDNGLGAEAAILQQAWKSSAGADGARAALALLDAYRARFPEGVLRFEAAVMQATLLLRAGDRQGALAILDTLPLHAETKDVSLVVTRGELRSLAGRCVEAGEDVLWALQPEQRAGQELKARARRADAACRPGHRIQTERAGVRDGAERP